MSHRQVSISCPSNADILSKEDELRGQTEAQVVVPVRWRVVVAVGRTAVRSTVIPAAAAIHTVGAPRK